MAKPVTKAELFDNFFAVSKEAFEIIEMRFDLKGLCDQLFGTGNEEDEQRARFKACAAWSALDALYEYAVHGIIDGNCYSGDLVIDGADVLKIITTENVGPQEEWNDIVAMADARFALDEGSSVELRKLSLLANVDVRTVRNAISAGELVAYKDDGDVRVDNATARRWLRGRRGFKPTVESPTTASLPIEHVKTPADFGRFVRERRQRLGQEGANGKLMVRHAAVTPESLEDLEAGVFSLPLDTVFPLADFYQVPHKDLLDCVMRVFFAMELDTLRQSTAGQGAA